MARIKTDKNISRKDVIVTKAAILFREKGFKAASMRDLAEAVGVEAAACIIISNQRQNYCMNSALA
jgi:AcrR family transcriptional regulator